jgi:hypothetical protein
MTNLARTQHRQMDTAAAEAQARDGGDDGQDSRFSKATFERREGAAPDIASVRRFSRVTTNP